MDEVNERTTRYLSVEFFDKAKALAAPTAVTYRVDCLTSGQQVKPWTAAPASSAVEIVLTADDNAMRDQANRTETRRVTVIASYGLGQADQVTAEHDYRVRNLRFVS